jgi:hypothetical protein
MGKDEGGAERRKYARIRTDAVMSIRPVEERERLVQGLDLGLGGVRFGCVGLELELGCLIEVTFNLGDTTATVLGKVVRLTDLDAFAQEIALAFVKVDPDILERFYDVGLSGEEEPEA